MKKLKAISKKQEAAYERVSKAIKAANKAGLVFYGKCGNLVAYTKQSDNYVNEHGFENCLRGNGTQIENISENLLMDSGADDFPSYLTDEDDPWHEA